LLADNTERNLSPKQVEFCGTIHSAGRDLLALINQVLDLSKIESGKQEVVLEEVQLAEVAERARRVFTPMAADKGLEFLVEVDPALPETIVTDHQRIDQILTNLLGNALKFTQRGRVTLTMGRAPDAARLARTDLPAAQAIAIAVSDTGIGIPPEEQERVFAPFQQLDARTDRRYGGTGLGLAIARELALLLGGELQLESAPGRGSTFTLFLHAKLTATARPAAALPSRGAGGWDPPGGGGAARLPAGDTAGPQRPPSDDRADLAPHEPYLLVVEDDTVFAEQLVEIIHARRFKVLVASSGEEALRLAKQHRPQGIILDVKLPDIDGWTVMERLGTEADTRGIPVHFASSLDAPERGLAMGAVGYLTKPASREALIAAVETLAPQTIEGSRQILVVEDDTQSGESLVRRLEGEGLQARFVQTGSAALEALAHDRFSCIVLDLGLPDMDGLGFLELLHARKNLETPPVVVYTGRALTKDETRRIEDYAEAVVLKEGRSTERLLEEIRLFIQHLKGRLPRDRDRHGVRRDRTADVQLVSKKILVVDDDMRTVYALSALLRAKGADVLVAETGCAALAVLDEHLDVAGVLMDVMMPEMDGYEAMRRIRGDPRLQALPVIALTAKAMKGERERCLEAGASDYLAKPIDADQLMAMLHRWLNLERSHAPRPRG
jgi:CheY-like chemotaxis protein/two-component sensor histidine kinase